MKPFVLTIILVIGAVTKLQAQSFLQHIQKKEAGKATVTVVQSHDIDELVDNADVSGHKKVETKKPENTNTTTNTTPHKPGKADNNKKAYNNNKEEHPANRNNIQHSEHNANAENNNETENEGATIDTRRKLPKRSYKVNGYRVQVLSGGNSRQDKKRVQQAGNDVKAVFPELPVYVHFYSPRWICRVGNFRSYEEASHILKQLKKLGFKEACIVSGKITVAY